jgi:hypothetical protein
LKREVEMKLRKVRVSVFAAVIFLLVLSFCPLTGWAETVTEERDVSSFHSVRLSTVGRISITQGKKQRLAIQATTEVLNILETEVRNGTLIISSRRNISRGDEPKISIEMGDIRSLGISGSGEIKGKNTFKVDALDLQINGSGNFILKLEAGSIDSAISGSGGIDLSGETGSLDVRISGSGELFAFNLVAESASIKVSGSGNCRVHVTEQLDVNVSGSGNVDYRGSPKVNFSGSGSGSIRSKE